MNTHTHRQLRIMFLLLDSSKKKPISSNFLAKNSDCSIRTIKAEVQHLNNILSNKNILRILSLASKGYYYEPIDEKEFELFKKRVVHNELFYRNFLPDELEWKVFFIQTLLSEDYITLDEIAYRANYSRSYFQRLVKEVREFFLSYNIELKSSASLGFYLKGKEEDIRECMVSGHIMGYVSEYIVDYYSAEGFKKIFEYENNEVKDVRHVLLKNIREGRITFRDIDTKRLSLSILVMKNRIDKGKYVVLDQNIKDELKDTYEYQLAKKIFNDEYISNFVKANEDEIYNFAKLLVLNRDYDINNQIEYSNLTNIYLNKAYERMDNIEKIILKNTGSTVLMNEKFKEYRNDIISNLLNVELAIHYNSANEEQLVSYIEVANSEVSIYSLELGRKVAMAIYELEGPRVSKTITLSIALVFDYFFLNIPLSYKKLHLACASTAGIVSSKRMAEQMMKNYGKYIENIDLFNQFEMRKINFEDYDGFLTDGDYVVNNYPIKNIQYMPYSLNYDFKKLFHELFIHNFDKSRIEEMISFTSLRKSICLPSEEDAMKLISQTSIKNNNERQLEVWLDKEYLHSHYFLKTNTAFLFCNYQYVNEEFIHVYELAKSSKWNGYKIKYLFVVSLDANLSIENIKITSLVLDYFKQDLTYTKDLYTDLRKTYYKIFKDIIYKEFFEKR